MQADSAEGEAHTQDLEVNLHYAIRKTSLTKLSVCFAKRFNNLSPQNGIRKPVWTHSSLTVSGSSVI
ncbi:MAG: hypothetical protein LZF60_380159 [Nitrospira sp.]|nr:MAG: hypothetical protein LZF60_380159 [Nitrospira sp.]